MPAFLFGKEHCLSESNRMSLGWILHLITVLQHVSCASPVLKTKKILEPDLSLSQNRNIRIVMETTHAPSHPYYMCTSHSQLDWFLLEDQELLVSKVSIRVFLIIIRKRSIRVRMDLLGCGEYVKSCKQKQMYNRTCIKYNGNSCPNVPIMFIQNQILVKK